eukprot:543519-Amorphochlora_amoeboformis.AAC.1
MDVRLAKVDPPATEPCLKGIFCVPVSNVTVILVRSTDEMELLESVRIGFVPLTVTPDVPVDFTLRML